MKARVSAFAFFFGIALLLLALAKGLQKQHLAKSTNWERRDNVATTSPWLPPTAPRDQDGKITVYVYDPMLGPPKFCYEDDFVGCRASHGWPWYAIAAIGIFGAVALGASAWLGKERSGEEGEED